MNVNTIRSDILECTLSPLGASIAAVRLTLPSGERRLISLAPTAFVSGVSEPAMAGRCIAPGCGRIRDAGYSAEGRAFTFVKNEGNNCLHGGIQSVQFRIWALEKADPDTVIYSIVLHDGEGGYPGERKIRVVYHVDGNMLTLHWTMETTASTPFDLTNHIYWDLTGRFDGSALDQTLTLSADRYVLNESPSHLPYAIASVEGTAFDFSYPMSFRERIEEFVDDQLTLGRGFNNAVIFRDNVWQLQLAAPDDGPKMLMTSDRPCVVIYTGGFLNDETQLYSGPASPGCAVALEAQSLPDHAHLQPETFRLIHPGEKTEHFISWRFV